LEIRKVCNGSNNDPNGIGKKKRRKRGEQRRRRTTTTTRKTTSRRKKKNVPNVSHLSLALSPHS
jgi:hypothetical protein